MRVLVTGANGHVGAHVVRALLASGHEVVAFVRKSADVRTLAGLDVTRRFGDVMQRDELRAAAEGCDAIVHLAAVYKLWAKTVEEIVEPAVRGTENVFAVARELGVKRIVLTSSCYAAGTSTGPEPRDESHWAEGFDLPYIRAKVESERLAHRLAEESGIALIVLLPSGVIGPWDFRMTPTMAFYRDVFRGSLPLLPGAYATVAGSDVGRAHVAALERGRAGERYLVTAENMLNTELAEVLGDLVGKRVRVMGVPQRILLGAAHVATALSKLTGRPPFATPGTVRDSGYRYFWYDNRKLREELGIEPRPMIDRHVENLKWLLHTGEVKGDDALRARYPADPSWAAASA